MDEQWVVDSLIGFLQSPEWTSPINNFIDENCVVFDPGDENKFSYTDIHNHYNKLVDQLLSQFTADLGITVDQLANACIKSSTLGTTYQKLLEQVSATEDFILFKSIMVQKNIDLEYQALKLLKSQLGHAPDIYDPSTPMPADMHLKNEEDSFQQALEESRREFETQKSLDEEEMKKLIDIATKESLLIEASKQLQIEQSMANISVADDVSQPDLKSTTLTVTKAEKVGTPPEVLEKSCSVEKMTAQKQLPESKQQAHLVPLSPEHIISTSTSEAASQWIQSAKKECQQHATTLPQEKFVEKKQPDIQSRETYLRRQRDHLLKSKRQARAKELDHYNTTKAPIVKKANVSQQTSASDDNTKPAGANDEKFFTGVLCSAIANKLKANN